MVRLMKSDYTIHKHANMNTEEITTKAYGILDGPGKILIKNIEKELPFNYLKNIIPTVIKDSDFEHNMFNTSNTKRKKFTEHINKTYLKSDLNQITFVFWVFIWDYENAIKCNDWVEFLENINLPDFSDCEDPEFQDPDTEDVHCSCGQGYRGGHIEKSLYIKNITTSYRIPVGSTCINKIVLEIIKKIAEEKNNTKRIKECDDFIKKIKKAGNKHTLKKNLKKAEEDARNTGGGITNNPKIYVDAYLQKKNTKSDEHKTMKIFIKNNIYPIPIEQGNKITYVHNMPPYIKKHFENYKKLEEYKIFLDKLEKNIENAEYNKEEELEGKNIYIFSDCVKEYLLNDSHIPEIMDNILRTGKGGAGVNKKTSKCFIKYYARILTFIKKNLPKSEVFDNTLPEKFVKYRKYVNKFHIDFDNIDFNKLKKVLG